MKQVIFAYMFITLEFVSGNQPV